MSIREVGLSLVTAQWRGLCDQTPPPALTWRSVALCPEGLQGECGYQCMGCLVPLVVRLLGSTGRLACMGGVRPLQPICQWCQATGHPFPCRAAGCPHTADLHTHSCWEVPGLTHSPSLALRPHRQPQPSHDSLTVSAGSLHALYSVLF